MMLPIGTLQGRFRGFNAAASLKPGRGVRRCAAAGGRFRGFNAAASLKRFHEEANPPANLGLPRF